MRPKRLIALAIAAGLSAPAQPPQENPAKLQESRELAQFGLVDPSLVVAWNKAVYEIAFAEDQFLTFKGHRAHAMMHIAMHDALNATIPLYRQYAYRGIYPFAHPIVAAAQAAYDVVLSQYPGQRTRLDNELATWISQVPDTLLKARGRDLGKQSAEAILALRAGDGWDFWGSYTFSTEIGAYQTTPPFNGFVFQPGFRYARPFGLRSPSQFRPEPPPPLGSNEYSIAYNEVKNFGRVDSTFRTMDQTLYAVWWMEFAEGSVNRLAREIVTRRNTNLWQAARMFALLNMSLFDGYVANWESKYQFNHWRPYTAIRQAALDGNTATEPDPSWEPLRTTPPHPEYASAHATGCAASFEVLRQTFGDAVRFTIETNTAPPEMPSRTFQSFTSAAGECADSRVRLGWHFRYSTNAGLKLGRSVANWLDENFLQFRATASR
jgi:hypothetical protein